MAFNLENMTVDYKNLMGLIPTERVQLAQSGQINDIISAMTPGQLVSMFPRYYRDQLPDVGQINQYTPSLDVALSGGVKYKQNTPGKDFYSPIYDKDNLAKTQTPEDKAIAELFSKAKVGGIELSGNAREKAAILTERMVKDLGISETKAAAIVGNFMHESGDFQHMQEISPTSGRGGYGWAQWTGPRRKNFEQFVNEKGLDINSDDANYQFFLHEIQNDPYERQRFEEWKNTDYGSLSSETVAFENSYERAGVKHHGSRIERAEAALQTYEQRIADIEQGVEGVKDLTATQSQFDPNMISVLDERLQKWYQNANEIQKKNFEEALGKLGTDQFNETMKRQPVNTATLGAVTAVPLDESRITESQTGFRQLPIKPELKTALEYAAEKSGLYVDIFSGGQDQEIHDAMEASGKNSSYRHNVDIKGIPGAADVILHVRDKNGKLVPLSVTNPEHAPYIAAFTENFSRVVPSAGVGANYMLSGNQVDPRKIHYGGPNAPGAPPATWGSMPGYLQEAHARGVAARAEDLKGDIDPLKEWQLQKQKEMEKKIKEEAEAKAQASPVSATENQIESQKEEKKLSADANSVPVLATGGEIPPGENIAGVNMNTGKVEFMANDRERIRVDPATLENTQQPAMVTQEEVARLETPMEPQQTRNPQPVPQPMSDPNMFEDLVAGYSAVPPSQVRATNRAKLYGEDSAGVVNGHFA